MAKRAREKGEKTVSDDRLKLRNIKETKREKHSKSKKATKAPPLLLWQRLPLEIEAGQGVPLTFVRGLADSLHRALQKRGIKELFPVQAASWRILAGGVSHAHDLCICAPTGSGKTLAYAIPLLQGLSGKPKHNLQALIVLPTRELAAQTNSKRGEWVEDGTVNGQVFEVIAGLSPMLGIWVGLAASKAMLAAEVRAFTENPPEVLVATPGRLMAHLKATKPTFTLNCLRFLVIDEMDRLLRQSYQNWLSFVMDKLELQEARSEIPEASQRVIKISVSATLTQDPSKIHRLNLQAPQYIAMSSTDHRYKVPKKLQEFKLVCAAADKPLLLIALLTHLNTSRTVVFTGSLEATNRLCQFLRQVSALREQVAEHSSTASGRKSESPGLLAIRAGVARILVASDALTRGMDVQGIDLVVNYDPADHPKTYVHRAGRTARAGLSGVPLCQHEFSIITTKTTPSAEQVVSSSIQRPPKKGLCVTHKLPVGTVISLLTADQVRHFKGILHKVDNTYVRDYVLPEKLVNSLRPDFQNALLQIAAKDLT